MRAVQGAEIWATLKYFVEENGWEGLGSDLHDRMAWARTCALPEKATEVALGREAMAEAQAALGRLLHSQSDDVTPSLAGGGRSRPPGASLLVLPATAASPPERGTTTTNEDFRRRTFELTALAGLARCPQVVFPLPEVDLDSNDATERDSNQPLAASFLGAHGCDWLLLEAVTSLAKSHFKMP
mmetsp:Transcript_54752/g.124698  ORF Transcript_54752/g.124698 Transcript_54752/m.124698 type:complete len:184 (+) Transcript_54752:735-1286(+)